MHLLHPYSTPFAVDEFDAAAAAASSAAASYRSRVDYQLRLYSCRDTEFFSDNIAVLDSQGEYTSTYQTKKKTTRVGELKTECATFRETPNSIRMMKRCPKQKKMPAYVRHPTLFGECHKS